jgi:hypothetical protein
VSAERRSPAGESGLLVCLPRDALRDLQRVRERLRSTQPRPRTASKIFSLSNLHNLSTSPVVDNLAANGQATVDSALVFLKAMAEHHRPPPPRELPSERPRPLELGRARGVLNPVVLALTAAAVVAIGFWLLFSRQGDRESSGPPAPAVALRPSEARPAPAARPPEARPMPAARPPEARPVAQPLLPRSAALPLADARDDDPELQLPETLTPAQIRRGLRRVRRGVQRCFRRRGRRGRAAITVKILSSGRVDWVNVRRAPRGVGGCIRRRVEAARFPEFRRRFVAHRHVFVVR